MGLRGTMGVRVGMPESPAQTAQASTGSHPQEEESPSPHSLAEQDLVNLFIDIRKVS